MSRAKRVNRTLMTEMGYANRFKSRQAIESLPNGELRELLNPKFKRKKQIIKASPYGTYHRKVLFPVGNRTMALMFYANKFYLRLESCAQASAVRSTVMWDSEDRALLALQANMVIWREDT
jgi:hypothetical protein